MFTAAKHTLPATEVVRQLRSYKIREVNYQTQRPKPNIDNIPLKFKVVTKIHTFFNITIGFFSAALMCNKLKIIGMNANGLLRHQNELQVVLNIENIDVCLIS